MKKFWAWLLLSSSDPEKASLTIKSIGATVVTYGIFFAGLFHKNVNADDLNVLTNSVANFIGIVLIGISSVTAIVAAIRKIFKSLNGTNEVINTGTTL